MLLVSEAYFFNEPAPEHQEQKVAAGPANREAKDFMGIPLLPADIALDVPAGWRATPAVGPDEVA